MPKIAKKSSKFVRPYQFHGVQIQEREGEQHAIGDCPFCGREGKFSVNVEDGLWRCYVCATGSDKGGGNLLTFLRLLWDESDKQTNGQTKVLAADRKLLHPETLTFWGIAQSFLTKDWLVPGYGPDGKLVQLYRYLKDHKSGRMTLFPTPEHGHGIHGAKLFDAKKPEVYLCEGPWDALALWEVLRISKRLDSGALGLTGSDKASLLSSVNVLAVPGCGSVGEPFKRWLPLLAGKRVTILFDSDHPRKHEGRTLPPAGFAAAKRAAQLMASSLSHKPAEIHFLEWGKEGYDPKEKSGHDIRDHLCGDGGVDVAHRIAALDALLRFIKPIPADWVPGRSSQTSQRGEVKTEPLPCSSWKQLLNGWRKALQMRESLEDALAVSMAVVASTDQVGDQLFLQMIGDAGSAKTRICDGLLVSKHCFALEHLTGFHSGWKGDDGEDYSLLSRINHKTLITPEGDVLISSPHFAEIMSQQRRIFDGTSGASYKNRKEDMRYTGLRTPWIIAGTPALMDTDQSRLGDRFLRICIDPPTAEDQEAILRRVGYTALRSVKQATNGDGSCVEGPLLEAYRLTGGWVDHLRANATELLSQLEVDEDCVVDRCATLARFTAILRARPNPDSRKDEKHDAKELPTRLTHQFVRLACCLAVATSRKSVCQGVLDKVRKVAVDMSKGRTMELIRWLHKAGRKGAEVRTLSIWTGHGAQKERDFLQFLKRAGATEIVPPDAKGAKRKSLSSQPRWRLTTLMQDLWDEAMSAG